MTWRMGPSFTMLLALWLVCGSEPHGQTMNRGSRGGQKVPLVSAVNRRPARLLRHTGRSQELREPLWKNQTFSLSKEGGAYRY